MHRPGFILRARSTFTLTITLTPSMATYVYETIPVKAGTTPQRFEVRQSMKDAALTRHPDTGEPVRRVIVGGFGLMGVGAKAATARAAPPAPCGPGCACHNGPRIPPA
jgi:predicted nucleic acid-binding Zn ribbon protein